MTGRKEPPTMTSHEIETRLRAHLNEEQAEEILGNKIHAAIAEVLKPFVGKKLTKRFTDKVTVAVSALFPEPDKVVCYYPHPGKLILWVHGLIPYDKRWCFFIAGEAGPQYPTHSTAHPTLDGFAYEDQAHGAAAIARIEGRARLLKDRGAHNPLRQLAEATAKLRDAKAEFERLADTYHYSVRHEAERIAQGR